MLVREDGFVLLPEPDAWGFSVMVVTIRVTIVVGWRSGPKPTEVDNIVVVMTIGLWLEPGLGLEPPPLPVGEEVGLDD